VKQSNLLLKALKRTLKHKGITYSVLAKKTNQSEANIKRIFSKESISVSQLETLCNVAEIELFELIKISKPRESLYDRFTEEQELELASTPKMFAILYLLAAGKPTKSILAQYEFTEVLFKRYVLKLDRLGLVELLPKDKIRSKITPNIAWITGGPLEKKYSSEVSKEFMNSSFSGKNEALKLLNGSFSESSIQILSRQMDKYVEKFKELSELDSSADRKLCKPISTVIGYRPWIFSAVSKYEIK
jgi:transcriptional regulator with XRE-family HTH domain